MKFQINQSNFRLIHNYLKIILNDLCAIELEKLNKIESENERSTGHIQIYVESVTFPSRLAQFSF